MLRRLKNLAKASISKGFHLGQRIGWDVLPRHFYSEIPDIGNLRRTTPWRKPYTLIDMPGANDLDAQQGFVAGLVTDAAREEIAARDLHDEASKRNGETGYGRIEAACLYALVHTLQPSKITQIGCGVSTALCLLAAEDSGYSPRITCIEPYPTDFLKREMERGTIELVQEKVEEISLDFLDDLSAGDLWFVDSTHTLGPAGEVTRLIVEMLPRLKAGVIVHFHDIWLPFDYSPDLLDKELFFWHETALLMAYLSGSRRARILASLSLLHHHRALPLKECFPNYQPMPMNDGISTGVGDFPSSIYLEMT